jgi:class 3 adenylate cyclase
MTGMPTRLPTGTVTMVFTDIEGSTRLLERAGDRYPELLGAHHAALREVWKEHGGVEEGTEGDAFFVLFVDPREAVAAAADAQRRLAAIDWPEGLRVRVRMGVHTGLVEQATGTCGAPTSITRRGSPRPPTAGRSC